MIRSAARLVQAYALLVRAVARLFWFRLQSFLRQFRSEPTALYQMSLVVREPSGQCRVVSFPVRLAAILEPNRERLEGFVQHFDSQDDKGRVILRAHLTLPGGRPMARWTAPEISSNLVH